MSSFNDNVCDVSNLPTQSISSIPQRNLTWKFDACFLLHEMRERKKNFCRKIESRSRSSIASVTVLNFSFSYSHSVIWTSNETSNSSVCFLLPACCIETWNFFSLSPPRDYKLGIILAPLKANYSTQFAANVMWKRVLHAIKVKHF